MMTCRLAEGQGAGGWGGAAGSCGTSSAAWPPPGHSTNEPAGPAFPAWAEVGAEGPSEVAEAEQLPLLPPSGAFRPDPQGGGATLPGSLLCQHSKGRGTRTSSFPWSSSRAHPMVWLLKGSGVSQPASLAFVLEVGAPGGATAQQGSRSSVSWGPHGIPILPAVSDLWINPWAPPPNLHGL